MAEKLPGKDALTKPRRSNRLSPKKNASFLDQEKTVIESRAIDADQKSKSDNLFELLETSSDSDELKTPHKKSKHNRISSSDEEIEEELAAGSTRISKSSSSEDEDTRTPGRKSRYNRISSSEESADNMQDNKEVSTNTKPLNHIPEATSQSRGYKEDYFKTPHKYKKRSVAVSSEDELMDNETRKNSRSSERLRAKIDKRGRMKIPDRKEELNIISPYTSNTTFIKKFTPRRKVSNFLKERSSYNCDRNETFISEDELSDFIDDENDNATKSEESEVQEVKEHSKKKKKKLKRKKSRKQWKTIESSTDDDDNLEINYSDEGSSLDCEGVSATRKMKSNMAMKFDTETDCSEEEKPKKKIPKRSNKQKENTLRCLAQLKKSRNLVKLPLDKRKSLLQNFNDEVVNEDNLPTEEGLTNESDEYVVRESDEEFVVSELSDDEDSPSSKTKIEAFFTRLTSCENSATEDEEKMSKPLISAKARCVNRKIECRRVVIASDSEEEENDKNAAIFFKSIKEDTSVGELKTAIESHLNLLNCFDVDGKGPLHLAAAIGHVPFINLLFNYKISANIPDQNNMLAIGYAAYYKHPEALRILLKKTNLHQMHKVIRRHSDGMSLLHLTLLTRKKKQFANVEERQLECLRVIQEFSLKMYNSMTKMRDHENRTPLMLAIEEGNPKCTEKLCLFKRAQHRVYTIDKEKIIHFAVANAPNCSGDDSAACLNVLLENSNLTLDAKDENGFTPLMYAAEMGNVACLETLCDLGADINCKDDQGTTPLHLAAATGSTECVQLLISHGHRVDCLDNYGWPPILYANFRASESCVVELMGANPEQLFILSDLIKCKDIEQRLKNIEVVRSTLVSLSHQDAYYKIFNDFIRKNPKLLDVYNHGVFMKTWKNILDFDNKYTWFKKKIKISRGPTFSRRVIINRNKVLESAMRFLELTESMDIADLNVTFDNEDGICLGPKKEFLDCFYRDIVRPERKLFQISNDQQFSLAPLSFFADIICNEVTRSKLKADSKNYTATIQTGTKTTPDPASACQSAPATQRRSRQSLLRDREETEPVPREQLLSTVGVSVADGTDFSTSELREISQAEILEGENDFTTTEVTEIDETGLLEESKKQPKDPKEKNKDLKELAKKIKYDLYVRLNEIDFIGRFVAACIASGFYINLHLTQSLIKEILNIPLDHPDDLKSFDFELFNGSVSWVLENSVDYLELPFSISSNNPWHPNRIEEIPLAEKDCLLTDENKAAYVKLVSEFKLQKSRKEEIATFKNGFYQEIHPEFIGMFTPDEFSLVMNGVQSIDVADWKANTEYSSLSEEHEVVTWFWKTVDKLKEEEKALLLKFSTGSPCIPVGGFKELEGLSGKTKFTIAAMEGKNKIPKASTCFNRLYLGEFDSEKDLREKVLVALRHGSEGFAFY